VPEGPAAEASRRAAKPVLFARLVKVEHSVYALPFAYAGAILAELALPSWQDLVWITVAMVSARAAAMALNRLIDAELDARNPRTASRELPTGRLRKGEVIAFTVVSLGVFILAAFNLSPPCRYLWPIVVAAFVLYPYTKRFTWLCHYALGLTDGLAPAAAWVAVSGSLGLAPVLLFFAVGLWVGGFDVIYACFDVSFDRREGIRSIPARFGEAAALRAATVSHVAAIVLLLWAGIDLRLPVAYYIGMVFVAAPLLWSSVDIGRRGLERVGMAFMSVNGLVGIVYLVVVATAVLTL
jgi:4-hydroxybenzoate polyprenyltransferase